MPDYNNYSSIFLQSSVYPGSSVKDLTKAGLLPNQIIIGKPSSATDSYYPNFYVEAAVLSDGFIKAYQELGWYGGYASDDFAND